MSDDFNKQHFDKLFIGMKPKQSVKTLLATEQRIPGLGNGILQDILFNAKVNPKREISSLTDTEKAVLLLSIQATIKNMVQRGGVFGNQSNYKTILSKNILNDPCPGCGNAIVKDTSNSGEAVYCWPICKKNIKQSQPQSRTS